jgi:hypothetical protein
MAWQDQNKDKSWSRLKVHYTAIFHRLRAGWCTNERDETKRLRLVDPHSPEKCRASSVVSICRNFSKPFNASPARQWFGKTAAGCGSRWRSVLGRRPKTNDNISDQFVVTGQPIAVRLFPGCSRSEIAMLDTGRQTHRAEAEMDCRR